MFTSFTPVSSIHWIGSNIPLLEQPSVSPWFWDQKSKGQATEKVSRYGSSQGRSTKSIPYGISLNFTWTDRKKDRYRSFTLVRNNLPPWNLGRSDGPSLEKDK